MSPPAEGGKIIIIFFFSTKQRCQCWEEICTLSFIPFLQCWFTSSILLLFFFFCILFFSLITKSFILPSAAPSVWLSLSWSQRPPTHSSLCCKYRGLDGTLLYLARQMCNYVGPFGAKSHSGVEIRGSLCPLSLPPSVSLFLFYLPFFLFSSPSCNLKFARTATIIWKLFERLESPPNTHLLAPGFSDITCCTCGKAMWTDDYSPQFEKKHTVWVFIMHICKACKACEGCSHAPGLPCLV